MMTEHAAIGKRNTVNSQHGLKKMLNSLVCPAVGLNAYMHRDPYALIYLFALKASLPDGALMFTKTAYVLFLVQH